jgi:predicted Rossmann-fold nucleotide-binding protein
MNVLVIGRWDPKLSAPYAQQAVFLGRLLARRNHTLLASPSSGIEGLVAQAYKAAGGKEFIAFYPDISLMEQMGEKALIVPDVTHYTEEDYPVRNLLQVKASDVVIGLTGGMGTVTELVAAAKDYGLPTGFCKGTSKVIDTLLDVLPEFRKDIIYSDSPEDILLILEKKHSSSK